MGKIKSAKSSVTSSSTEERSSRRHRKRPGRYDNDDRDINHSFNTSSDISNVKVQTPIKLKIKIGGETMSTQNISVTRAASPVPEPIESIEVVECEEINVEELGENFIIDTLDYSTSDSIVSSQPAAVLEDDNVVDDVVIDDSIVDDEDDDDDSRWLAALESGDLDDNGDVKRSNNSVPLTARQKALLHGENISDLMQLPSGYRNVQLTEEQLKGKEEKANQRRQLALEKTEKHKKDTVDRLLKKQDAKAKIIKTFRDKKSYESMYRYTSSLSSISISVPTGFHFPLEACKAPEPPPVQLCGVDGCKNSKKYSCSKSGIPLCSLQCYRINLQRLDRTNIPAIVT